VRESVLATLDSRVEPGQSLSAVEAACEEHGLSDVSAVLSTLGYRVEWEGLTGGTVAER
jgi:hypothetical protein